MTQQTPTNRCLSVIEWPQEDQAAWRRGLLPVDPFDVSVGLASHWKPATQTMIAGSYGRWLGWLDLFDCLDPSVPAGERASRAQVIAYRDALNQAGLADYSVAGRIKHLGDALTVIDPAGDWTWIKRAASRLHAHAEPRRDVLSIMQPPEAILQLGQDLMGAAETQRFRTPCAQAVLFRDGLLLNFLTLRPLRMANLASLALGESLEFRDGWRLQIDGYATKGGVSIDCAWPERLTAALERYLSVHREVLLKAAVPRSSSQALWISKRGAAMCPAALSFQIKDRTREHFGKPINPHTFRHIAATTIATCEPTESAAIALVLGHTSMAASEKYYNRAQILAACERMQDNVARLRQRKC